MPRMRWSTCWSTQQEPWLENIYRPVGNAVIVQQPVADDEPDEEYERNFQRGDCSCWKRN